jgi:regulator of protease activity HflC (stomatin/prohibitin superfamily)
VRVGKFLQKRKEQTMNIEPYLIVTIATAGLALWCAQALKVRNEFVVPQGFVGLLYRNGRFVELLNSGGHIRWGRSYGQYLVDLRKTSLRVTLNDVLTSDNVALKLTLSVGCQMTDPAMSASETHWTTQLETAVQLAARELINSVPFETLMKRRSEFVATLLARIEERASQLGVTVFAVDVAEISQAPLRRASHSVNADGGIRFHPRLCKTDMNKTKTSNLEKTNEHKVMARPPPRPIPDHVAQ